MRQLAPPGHHPTNARLNLPPSVSCSPSALAQDAPQRLATKPPSSLVNDTPFSQQRLQGDDMLKADGISNALTSAKRMGHFAKFARDKYGLWDTDSEVDTGE